MPGIRGRAVRQRAVRQRAVRQRAKEHGVKARKALNRAVQHYARAAMLDSRLKARRRGGPGVGNVIGSVLGSIGSILGF